MSMVYEFGYPTQTRIMEIQQLVENHRGEKQYIEYQGKYRDLPVVEVKIELPVYRIENVRTKNLQKEYIAKHPDISKDIFTADPYSIEAQETQHILLSTLVKRAELLKTFKDSTTQQTEPLICTDEGVVVNGNRRLCAWRELYYANREKYKHFQTVKIAVLPNHDPDALYDLEVALQIKKDIKDDYAWHTIAADFKEKIKIIDINIFSKKQGKNAKEIIELIECYDYAESYLESIGHTDEWSLVDNDFYAFQRIVRGKNSLKESPAESILFQEIANCFLKKPEATKGERLYSRIPKIIPALHDISDSLQETLEVSVNGEDDELDDLWGEDTESSDEAFLAVAEAVRNTDRPDVVVETANAVIDTYDQLEKEKKNKKYILNQVTSAAKILDKAIKNLNDNMDKKGVDKQIENIEACCYALRGWLK